MARTRRALLALLLSSWAVALAANRSLRRVRGGSMAPTLPEGALVVALPVRTPRRGEVVLVRDPRDPGHVHLKRVVGLPGEEVAVRDGTLLLDGRPYHEAHRHGRGPDGVLSVPPGHVAVLGDARAASTDSRTYGAVPLDLVTRRVPWVVRPRPRRLRSAPVPLEGTASDPHGS